MIIIIQQSCIFKIGITLIDKTMKLKMAYAPRITFILILVVVLFPACSQRVTTLGKSAKLEIREAAENGIRITLKPVEVKEEFPYNPALAEREYPDAAISIRYLRKPISKQVGKFTVQVSPDPFESCFDK